MDICHGSAFTHKSFLSPSGNVAINYSFYGMHALTQNVRGIQVPNSGSLDSRRAASFVTKLPDNFFAVNTTNTTNTTNISK